MLKEIAICVALIGVPHAAVAQSVQDQIVVQLRAQGFSEIAMNRTWLGRVRIIALRDDLRRELVFNPQTGEILRDFSRTVRARDDDDNDNGGPNIFNPGGGGSSGGIGSGKDNDDERNEGHDDDDDRDDDDDDDDRDDDDDDDD